VDETMKRTDVLVGIDGSEPSRAALRWAATEAQYRGASLRVLLAHNQRVPGMRFTESGELEQVVREDAEKTVDQAVEEARVAAPGVTVRGDVVAGTPARVLIDLSCDAGLTVVGSRGLGGFAGLLLGSVGSQVAEHAHSPVVVVRGRSDTAGGSVVAGVDGSPFSDDALGQAFQEASWRGCTVVARTAYTLPLPTRTADVAMLTREREVAEATLREELARMISGWRTTYPMSRWTRTSLSGAPSTC
jgi:nucleotide-binding universal stress UspA family protein